MVAVLFILILTSNFIMKESSNESIHDEEKDKNNVKDFIKISESITNYDYFFSICLIGRQNVGKTSLLYRFSENKFTDNYINTIGVDFKVISLKYKGHHIKVNMWDTAGQERFKSITINYFRIANGFFFVYDVNNKDSFDALSDWICLAKNNNKESKVNFLVGNKVDLQREVSKEEAIQFAEKNNLIYFETSAINNENVDESFYYMTKKLILSKNEEKRQLINPSSDEKNSVFIGHLLKSNVEEKKENNNCC